VEDAASFARLVEAVRPWLGHLVVVGGWAHRLHRLHPLAGKPTYLPLRTRDVDVALSLEAPLEGNIREALEHAGFSRLFSGDNAPPVTHYHLGDDDRGFYAEFLVPLRGAELTRHGQPNVTAAKAGITAQKLRYLDLLLDAPWPVRVGPDVGVPLDRAADLLLPNPVSFIVQKLLIPDKRPGNKKAQDVLYIHDTLELFGGALDNLRTLWLDQLRPKMPGTTAKRVETTARAMFEQVTDTIREAARIPQDRRLSPDVIRAACQYGLSEILGSTT
jgi:Nucleotidyltransferase